MKRVFLLILIVMMKSSFAIDFINVPDASFLKWQLDSAGNVWFRNLNDFDGSFLGCCYNYSLNLTTPNGKAIWTTIMLKMATSKPISIGVNDKSVPSAVLYSGNH